MPVLILSGDLDPLVPTSVTRELLRVFPGRHLPAGGRGRTPHRRLERVRPSGRPRVRAVTRRAGRLRRARLRGRHDVDVPASGRGAVPARPEPGTSSTVSDRRIVTAAVQTVRDAWLRSFRVPGSAGPLAGLRGGAGAFGYATSTTMLRSAWSG